MTLGSLLGQLKGYESHGKEFNLPPSYLKKNKLSRIVKNSKKEKKKQKQKQKKFEDLRYCVFKPRSHSVIRTIRAMFLIALTLSYLYSFLQ